MPTPPSAATSRVSPLRHDPAGVVYAREQAGYRQSEAAAELAISAGFLCQIEKGVRSASPALLKKMAEVYNCPRVVLERKREAVA